MDNRQVHRCRHPVADVITVAKRNLKAGEVLDGSGGYTVNGLIEKAEIARAENLLPLGLAYDVKLKRDVPQGEAISYDMVGAQTKRLLFSNSVASKTQLSERGNSLKIGYAHGSSTTLTAFACRLQFPRSLDFAHRESVRDECIYLFG